MFKRNQVEEAIALVLEPGSIGPSMELCTRIKRLLDTDRSLGRNKRSNDPERADFAFYSIDAGGRGTENWFSDYEAFALLTGLRLMRQGWPQGYVVSVLRRVKRELQRHYGRIIKRNPVNPFKDQKQRQKGTPNALSPEYRNAVLEAAYRVGIDGNGLGGIVGYCMWIAACYPQVYILALIRLLELENSHVADTPRPSPTVDGINERLRSAIGLCGEQRQGDPEARATRRTDPHCERRVSTVLQISCSAVAAAEDAQRFNVKSMHATGSGNFGLVAHYFSGRRYDYGDPRATRECGELCLAASGEGHNLGSRVGWKRRL